MHVRTRATFVIIAALGLASSGCATTTAPVHAESYGLQLKIDPQQSKLSAIARIHCRVNGPTATAATSNLCFDFALHPDLDIENLSCDDAPVKNVRTLPLEPVKDGMAIRQHRVTLEGAPSEFELTVAYTGRLEQDVSAGEKRGEIHNFGVSAHIGTNGIYLSSGAWYPRFDPPQTHEIGDQLAHFEVQLEPVQDHLFVCSASRRDRSQSDNGYLRFESSFPQTGLALVGGRFQEWTRDVDGIRFAIMLNPANADATTMQRRADIFLDAAESYYDRYRPLVGPYPYDEFTIVENFFSSGFAFPTFTLLGPAVIAMEDRALRHGYLDHEFLHSWWGNGVYVDPADGNWCEALTSFAANLYGYTLDGDAEGARKTRRDACNILTRISSENDKPLATFGQTEGANRSIGYQKGAVVFNMIARKIGIERFWQAMRNLSADDTGQLVGWERFRKQFERVSGMDLKPFFDQWVYGSGAPRLLLSQASIRSSDPGNPSDPGNSNDPGNPNDPGGFVEIRQDEPTFLVELPLRYYYADGSFAETVVPVSDALTRVPFDGPRLPTEVELDPDYHVARKLADEEILPTLGGSLRGERACLVSPGDRWPGYELFAKDIVTKRTKDTTDQLADPDADALSQHPLIIIGPAVHQPEIESLIERSECPIRWGANGFEIDGVMYDSPLQSVLCTFRHPDAPGKTVTIYYGNSAESLSNAEILWFYGNSLLVFDSQSEGRAEVVLRHDFERTQRIPVVKSF